MHRITILYGTPTDAAAFDDHYFAAHIPMASALPGLQRFTWSKPRALDQATVSVMLEK